MKDLTPCVLSYDAMGNLTNDGKYTNTYLNNGRLRKVAWTVGTTTNTVTYDLNALGQRVRKAAPSSVAGTRRFMYDEAGRLAGEYDSAGKLVQETVWLGDTPIATLRPKSGSITTPIAIDTFYVHADHLGTPRVITRPTDNKVVWSWENTEAFGNNAVNENPSALGAFSYNLRMPGQYFDQETGTFYNYFRDYDPGIGRYVQSDPIGLGGGVSTFGYVGGNPIANYDPFGLQSCPAPPDSCPPLILQINQTVAQLNGRYIAMLTDPENLWVRAFQDKIPGREGLGTWKGHQGYYDGLRKGLGRMIDNAVANGCSVPPDAYLWRDTPAPPQPLPKTPLK